MSNSKLVSYTKLSPNCTKPRTHTIDKITIHHMAGNLSVETCGAVFASASRQASANYGIGTDGRVGLYVDEANRSWCSSNAANDHRAVTIEVANDTIGGDWHISDTALAKLIDLCVDVCQRNGIARLNYTGDASGNLTMHKFFTATACPGPYLESKFPYIAEQVNARLGAVSSGSSTTTAAKLTVDGLWGSNTTKRLQQIFGTTVDGIVSNQLASEKTRNPGLTNMSGWDWKTKPTSGSPLIKAIQSKVGVTQDGWLGKKTITAMQKWLGTGQDGIISNPSAVVKALQTWCNSQA